MRQCCKCRQLLELSAFTKDNSRKDGLRAKCRACKAAEYRPPTPEQKAKLAENTRRYKARHPERIRERRRLGYRKNHAKALATQRAWVEKNREKVRLYVRARNAARRANGGRWNADIVLALRLKQMDKCAICRDGIGAQFHVDHIVPLALGGGNEKYNLQLLCPDCNLRKKDKHPIVFMQSRGYLL